MVKASLYRDLVVVVLGRVHVVAGAGVVHDRVETVNKTMNIMDALYSLIDCTQKW